MKSLNLSQAFSLMMKTSPIILVRLGANLLFWFVAIIYFLIVGTVAYLIGNAVPILGFIVFIVAIAGMGGLYHLAYKYVFYMLKAAHIAVLSDLLKHGKLKSNEGQLGYGKQRVQERFGEMSAMFVVDELISGVVRSFTRTVYRISRWIPGDNDAISTMVKILNRVIWYSTTYIDEAILARSFYEETDDVWDNARDGVVLYGMKWKPILMNAIALMVISFIPFIVALVIFALPVGLLISLISTKLAGWSIIMLLLLSWLVKVAVGDSFAMTAILATYYRETKDLTPDPEMASRLEGISDKFKDMTNRARSGMGFGDNANTNTPQTPDNDTPNTPTTAPQTPL
ncbi:MAG: hypothetical protein RLP44_19455 [Aggregatilineales bacterium]